MAYIGLGAKSLVFLSHADSFPDSATPKVGQLRPKLTSSLAAAEVRAALAGDIH